MCGIIAVVSRPSRRTTPALAALLDPLHEAAAALEGVDAAGAAVASSRAADLVAAVDALLHGVPGITALLDSAIKRGQRDATAVAVVFLDLNGFKAVNDGLGHEAGDEVLAAVGRRLAGTIRRDDVLGRWGGDEFVVVVSSEEEQAVPALAARLHAALSQPVAIRGRRTVELGLAIGAAEVRPGEGVDEVISRADGAMFEAKRSGQQLVLAPPPPEEGPG